MKLNEGYFSVKTAITYFCDKFFQEVNFKSHLNSALRCKYGKILWDLHMSDLILFCVTSSYSILQ